MKTLVIHPFFSQQNKVTGRILLDSCGAWKQLSWLAPRLTDYYVAIVQPYPEQCDTLPRASCRVVYCRTACPNPIQRIHWDTWELARTYATADVALLNHEFLAIPLRTMFPSMRIITMCSVKPDSPLFSVSFGCSDLVVAQGEYAATQLRKLTSTPVTVWPLAYDASTFSEPKPRMYDVCFVNRCSYNNATHHAEFLASGIVERYRTVFTDVTEYLRQRLPNLHYSTPETYVSTLHSTAIAVAMYDSHYGGLSIREAIAAGCIPVVLDCPCYRELVGDSWPGLTTPDNIMQTVSRVMDSPPDCTDIRKRVAQESYQASLSRVKRDL